ncbi:peptide/nickel transport system permease protein [Paraburkholderia sp. GAS199]|uniref:ABC transporter permease n=1 Tax=Paraburkholderia sp. GAS199 TaxID=3035126 RepID=UPI003D1FDC54
MMADSSLSNVRRKPHALGTWLASAARLLRALMREPAGAIGLVTIVLLIVVAVSAPWLPLQDPLQLHIEHRLEAPGAAFWFGTDQVGRDILSRTIWGARASLSIGLCAVAIGLMLGTGIGLVAGYKAGSWLDETLMKLMEVLASIPLLIWAIALVGITGTDTLHLGILTISNETKLVLLIGVLYAPGLARLTHSLAKAESQAEYVAARVLQGAGGVRIMLSDVLPNIVSPVLIQATLLLGVTIIVEASLSFIGLGVQPPTPSWGAMLSDARALVFTDNWWVSAFPGAAVFVSVLAFNLFGDSMRTILDPRRRNARAANVPGASL